ncbi:MAG TPA: hypothetical protein VFC44_23980 [Candidatus Saccharimonadales bacterium]|nr:hypothetical protein [Candidatus Saccharimonadales bacterium]
MPAHDWLLVGCGDQFSSLRDKYLQQIKAQGRPAPKLSNNWLEAEIDGTQLAAWPHYIKPFRLNVNLSTKAGNLQIEARAVYPKAMPWRSDSWRLPKELIRSPLISFTAAQDVAAFLNLDPVVSRIENNPLTNQFFIWALGQMPLQTYMAWPVAGATNALERFSSEAPAALNPVLEALDGTELLWLPNYKRLVMSKLRVVTPALQAAWDKASPFLMVELFPRSPMNEPAPEKLREQLDGRTNLVYYDWELTGLRLQQWHLLGRMLLNRAPNPADPTGNGAVIEEKWLTEISSLSGNTVTEITRVSPNELSLVRNSPAGLTGIELFLFSEWASGVGFGPINGQQPAVMENQTKP